MSMPEEMFTYVVVFGILSIICGVINTHRNMKKDALERRFKRLEEKEDVIDIIKVYVKTENRRGISGSYTYRVKITEGFTSSGIYKRVIKTLSAREFEELSKGIKVIK